uniref:Uncharacterized protein n=1 Tax=Cannabis sativa TaxID=3483 RepID=A0A803QSU8_CANSA
MEDTLRRDSGVCLRSPHQIIVVRGSPIWRTIPATPGSCRGQALAPASSFWKSAGVNGQTPSPPAPCDCAGSSRGLEGGSNVYPSPLMGTAAGGLSCESTGGVARVLAP